MDQSLGADGDLVYDVGANNGDDSAYYLAKGCRVVAIDANPEMCQALQSRFRDEIQQRRMTVVNLGVSDRPGRLDFHVNRSKNPISTFDRARFAECEWVPDDWETVPIDVARLSDLVKVYGEPFFIKIDVEFYDQKVLLDLLLNGLRPRFISAEAQDIEVYCLLVAMGYNSFRLISGATVHEEFGTVTIGTMSGVGRDFRFVYDSSGPFGDDLENGWTDKLTALRELLSRGLGWIDIHARFDEA